MADTKVSALTQLTAPASADRLYIVDDPAGTPVSKYATVQDVIGGPSLFVAASNATAEETKHADYVCDGTADESQINSAIAALPTGGGKIKLSSGTFTVAKAGVRTTPPQGYCVLIDQNDGAVVLEGSGWSTIVKLADNQDANTCAILIRGDSGDMRNSSTVVRDMKVDGNLTGQGAAWTDYATVEVAYGYDFLFDNLWIVDPTWVGLRPLFRSSERATVQNCKIDASNGKVCIRTEGIHGNIINNYMVASNTVANSGGLSVATNADLDIPSEFINIQGNTFNGGLSQANLSGARHCTFLGNRFVNSTHNNAYSLVLNHYDAVIDYSCFENVVIGNAFENIRWGILLSSGANVNLSNYRNLIQGNTIIDGATANLAYGIFESGANVDNNMIIDNIIQGASVAPIVKAGGSTIVRGNKGYVTEKSGAAAAVADGGTIAHGCAATPTSAQVTGSVANEFVSVTGIGAANLTVAIKKHDGTPGTAQTIYWRAWV